MAASDQTVANLRRKFDEALRQKKEVLGELRQENTVAEQSLFGGVSLDEARTMSDEDLKSLASDSASTAVKALGKSFKVSAASIGDFTKSEGGQELASSAVDFITGVKVGSYGSVARMVSCH
jgi:predicted nucleotidyltransferase